MFRMSSISVLKNSHITVLVFLVAAFLTPLFFGGHVAAATAPVITSVSPGSGLASGGDTLTISGSDFDSGATVSFSGTTAASVTFINANTLTVVTPTVTVGNKDIIVTNSDAQKATLARSYIAQLPAPTVSSLTPNSGSPTGGTQVAVSGSGFSTSLNIEGISANGHSCEVTDGEAYCWGDNGFGQLGNGTTTPSPTPVKVTQAAGILAGKTVTSIAVGSYHTCAIASGEAYCWGYNVSGELGDGTTTASPTPVKVTQAAGLLAGKTVTAMDVGAFVSCAVASGEAYCWGSNSNSSLGAPGGNSSSPVKVTQAAGILAGKTVTAISTTRYHTCAVASGEAYCWGDNSNGKLGDDTFSDRSAPVKVQQLGGFLFGKTVTAITTGAQHTCAVASGEAYCWGISSGGQLGYNSTSTSSSPVKVSQTSGMLLGKTVTAISASNDSTCVIASGEVFCWGLNNRGQLGNNTTNQANLPVKVTQAAGLLSGKTVTALSVGSEHACAIADYKVYCWGDNQTKQLGTTVGSYSAVPIASSGSTTSVGTVLFGGAAAVLQSVSTGSMTVTTPAHAGGVVDVQIGSTSDYFQPLTVPGAFTYTPPPSATSASPSAGDKSGGDVITISGQNFVSGASVAFGANQATNVSFVSDTTLQATTPASASDGQVNIVITNPDGQFATLTNGFTYKLPPATISSSAPGQGKMGGGTVVTLTGSNFSVAANPSVTFGGVAGTSVAVIDPSHLQVTAPARATLGAVDIVYTDKYGQSVTRTDAYTYLPQSYGFTNPARTLSATEPGQFTVTAYDTSLQPIVAAADIELNLSSSSATGFFARSSNNESPDAWQYDSVILPAGSATATFYYKDNASGQPLLTASDAASTSASQSVTIGSKYKLQVTGVTNPVQAGVPSSVTIRAVNYKGEPETGYTGTISFESDDVTALLPANFTMTAAMRGVHTFVNGVTLRTPGEWCVGAKDVGNATIAGTQCDVLVTQPGSGTPARLKILTSKQYVQTGLSSSVITAQLQDGDGMPIAPSQDMDVYITSNSSTGVFRTDTNQSWSTGSTATIAIPAGATSVNFYYRDTAAGDHMILAADRQEDTFQTDLALVNDTQHIVTGVGEPAQLRIKTATDVVINQRVPIIIELQDSTGSPVTAPEDVSFFVDSLEMSTDIFRDDTSAAILKPLLKTLQTGSTQTTIYMSSDTLGQTSLTVEDVRGSENPESYASDEIILQIVAAEPYAVRFLPVGEVQVSQPVEVAMNLVDIYGNVTQATEPIAIELTSDTASGSFRETPTGTAISSVEFDSGISSQSVYYFDTNIGDRNITATPELLESDSLQFTVVAGPYSRPYLDMEKTIVAGTSEQYDFMLGDAAGFESASDQPVILSLDDGGRGGTFSLDGTTWNANSVTVPTGETSGQFYYRNTSTGSVTLRLIDSNNGRRATAQQMVIAAAPSQAHFNSDEQIIIKDTSSEAISVTFTDAYGNETVADQSTVLTFTSSSATGRFSLDGTDNWSDQITKAVTPGSLQQVLHYKDSRAGVWNLSVTASGYTGDVHAIEVVNGLAQKSVIISSSQTIEAGEVVPVTLETQTNDGLPAPVRSDTDFILHGEIGEFSETASPFTPISRTKLLSGHSSKQLYYRSTTIGSKELSAQANAITPVSSQIQVTAAGIYKLSSLPSALGVPMGSDSSPIAVTVQDIYGNIAQVAGDMDVYAYSDSGNGTFKVNGNQSAQATITAGDSTVSFTYADTAFHGSSVTTTFSDKGQLDSPDEDVVNAQTAVTITGQTIGSIEMTADDQLVAGERSEPIHIKLKQNNGTPAYQDGSTQIGLGSTVGGKFFDSSGQGAQQISQITVPAGQAEVVVYYQQTKVGLQSVTAQLSGKAAATEIDVIAARPSSMEFASQPQTQRANVASDQIMVKFYDEFQNEAVLNEDYEFALESSCASGEFSVSAANWQSVHDITLRAGSDQLVFYYRDSIKANCSLQVQTNELAAIDQEFIVEDALAAAIQFVAPNPTYTLGQTANVDFRFTDINGNIVPLSTTKTLYLAEQGKPVLDSKTVTAGAGQASFTYEASKVGQHQLVIRDQAGESEELGSLTDASTTVTVVAGAPSAIGIESGSTARAGSDHAVTIRSLNSYGAAVPVGTDTTLELGSSGNGEFRATPGGSAITEIEIPAGDTDVTVYYTQTQAEVVTITAKDSSGLLSDGSAAISIIGADIVSMHIISSGTMIAGERKLLGVELRDRYGNATTADVPIRVYLGTNANSGRFYATDVSNSAISSVVIPANNATYPVYYQDSSVGTVQVSVRDEITSGADTGIVNGTQNITIEYGQPAQVSLSTHDFTLVRGEVYGKLQVIIKNSAGVAMPAPSDMTVQLSATASGSEFSTSVNGSWSHGMDITVPAGSSSADFYFRNTTDVQSSLYYLYAATDINGQTVNDRAQFTLLYGAPKQLSFTSAPQTIVAQHASNKMTVELRNQYGVLVGANADTKVYLRSSSGTAEFGSDANSGWGLNYVVLPKGEDRVDFYYRDATQGNATITATDNVPAQPDINLTNATQAVTVTEQVFDHFYVANISDPQKAGNPSSVVVIAQDADNYTIADYAGSIHFSSDDPDAQLPGDYTFTPGKDKGSKTFVNAVVFTTPGEKTVTVTDQNGKSGQQVDITVDAPNTNAVRAVDIVYPPSPYSLGLDQVSDPVTVQLKDANGEPTTSPAGGYTVRISSNSNTAEIATSSNGPWQQQKVLTIPEGYSSTNVYIRNSQLETWQLQASDWIDAADNTLIANGELTIAMSKQAIQHQALVRSKSALGGMKESAYLFAHNFGGDIESSAELQFTSQDMRNNQPLPADWHIVWKQQNQVLDQFNQRNVASVIYELDQITARAGDSDYEAEAHVTSVNPNLTKRVTVPVSPWTVETGNISSNKKHAALTIPTHVQRSAAGNQLAQVQYSLYATNSYAQPVAQATQSVASVGQHVGAVDITSVSPGQYQVLTQLLDSSKNILAENISSTFNVSRDGVVDVLPPSTITTGTTPDSGVSSADGSADIAPPSSSVDGNGNEAVPGSTSPNTGSNNSFGAKLSEILRKIASSPYTPIGVPLLFLVALMIFIGALVAQILRQIQYGAQLQAIAKKERQTAKDKVQFTNLIAHHLRTPVTIISGAVELLASMPKLSEYATALQPSAAAVAATANNLVKDINRRVELPSGTLPDEDTSKVYQLPSFWIAAVLGAVVLIGVNILTSVVGNQSTNGYTLLGQLLIIFTAVTLLYFALQERINRRNLNARQTQAMHHSDQLDSAKNEAIKMVADQLQGELLGLQHAAAPVIANNLPGAKQLSAGIASLEKIVRAMTTLSSIESARVFQGTVDLGETVARESMEHLEVMNAKQLTVQENLEVDHVSADPALFNTVFESVFENALAFSPEGGEVAITSTATQDTFTVAISDSGPGLPVEVTDDVLRPFTHPGDELTEAHQGLGLSLYLDTLIMRHLGGEILFDRTEKGGANVRLVFPGSSEV